MFPKIFIIMKTIRILFASVLCLMSMAVVGCSDNDEPEAEPIDGYQSPTTFSFYVVDENNNPALTDYTVATARNNIKIIYDGKIYRLDAEDDNASYHFFSLRLRPENNWYVLRFGTFKEKTDKETFTIDYGNGTQDVVMFSSTSMLSTPEEDYHKLWINNELKIDQESAEFYLLLKGDKLTPYNDEQNQ